ncbi:MAG: ABC transporter substrate-binding protein, partial [Desulfobacterales bacterium]|nr:ABC transporter substrate-binding protein [Desulfobacterales bacterium]
MKTYNVKLGSLVLAAMLLTGTTLASNALGARKIKWAHVYETSEDYHKQAVWAAEEITKRSDGRYQVSVFPSSSLGKEADINQGLALGTVDIIYTGQSFAAQTYGPLALSDVPYVFRDFDHWQKYAKSDFFAEMADGYA